MIMGMVPLVIQDPMRIPTESMMRIAGMALAMLSTMPFCMSAHLKRSARPRMPVRKAAVTRRTWGRIR